MPQAKRRKLLSSTRPKQVREQESNWSSKKTRTTIRTHHQLQKRLTQAKAAKDDPQIAELQAQLEKTGGLAAYQHASTIGQSKDRGGDTSKVLLSWLVEASHGTKKLTALESQESTAPDSTLPYRLLEVGCLKVDNACAQSGLFNMRRIDLQSQHRDIEQQDFMMMEPPDSTSLTSEGYDLISLSLVLNYVSDPVERGQMLRHAGRFLRDVVTGGHDTFLGMMPAIFVVLPLACVANSRYLDESRFTEIMSRLGYELARNKYTEKLAYLLWRRIKATGEHARVAKQEVQPGKARNNFAIVLG